MVCKPRLYPNGGREDIPPDTSLAHYRGQGQLLALALRLAKLWHIFSSFPTFHLLFVTLSGQRMALNLAAMSSRCLGSQKSSGSCVKVFVVDVVEGGKRKGQKSWYNSIKVSLNLFKANKIISLALISVRY